MRELNKKTKEKTKTKIKEIKLKNSLERNQEHLQKKYTIYFQNQIRDYLKETNLIEEIKTRFNFYIKNVSPGKDIFYGFVKPEHMLPSHVHDKENRHKDSLMSHGYLGDILYLIAVPRIKDAIIDEYYWDEAGREFMYKNIDSKLYVTISIKIDFNKNYEFGVKLLEKNPDGPDMSTQELLDCKEIHAIELAAYSGVGQPLDHFYCKDEEQLKLHDIGDKTDIEYLLFILDEYISEKVSDAQAIRSTK